MNVTYCCPRCERTVRVQLTPDAGALVCPECGLQQPSPEGARDSGKLSRCLVCPSDDLFVRKDFPQRLGLAIVVVGFAASCVAWGFHRVELTFGILLATALVDFLLYVTMGECLTCYRCGAQYRAVEGLKEHDAFDLATHERYRQQAARMAEHNRASSARQTS